MRIFGQKPAASKLTVAALGLALLFCHGLLGASHISSNSPSVVERHAAGGEAAPAAAHDTHGSNHADTSTEPCGMSGGHALLCHPDTAYVAVIFALLLRAMLGRLLVRAGTFDRAPSATVMPKWNIPIFPRGPARAVLQVFRL